MAETTCPTLQTHKGAFPGLHSGISGGKAERGDGRQTWLVFMLAVLAVKTEEDRVVAASFKQAQRPRCDRWRLASNAGELPGLKS